jgi:hypothetical protein
VTHLEGSGHVVDLQRQLFDRLEVAVPLGQVQESTRVMGVLALRVVAHKGLQHCGVSLPPQVARRQARPTLVVKEQLSPPHQRSLAPDVQQR